MPELELDTQQGHKGGAGEVAVGSQGIEIRTLRDLYRFSQYVAKSGLAPKGFETPEKCLIAIEYGLEIGLKPIQALQNIMLVNGRPALWGDAVLAVVENSGLLEDFWEEVEGTGDKMTATCYAKRRGRSRGKTQPFSVADAKQAGLWDKPGPWKQYPQRMLAMRARSWALRDAFPDVLKGVRIVEEAMDTPPGNGGVSVKAEELNTALAEPSQPAQEPTPDPVDQEPSEDAQGTASGSTDAETVDEHEFRTRLHQLGQTTQHKQNAIVQHVIGKDADVATLTQAQADEVMAFAESAASTG